MAYPKDPGLRKLVERLGLYAQLKHEYGAEGIEGILGEIKQSLKDGLDRLRSLPVDEALAAKEPDALEAIRSLRPDGPRRMWEGLASVYPERVAGALQGRFAGCTLGAPVEGNAIKDMAALAEENGDDFPPTDYWSSVSDGHRTRYGMSRRDAYTRSGMDGVPVDDDIAYTLLGLLILEDHGPDFTVEQVGESWLKYLPTACTAERVALANLKDGIPAERAAEVENPYTEWIGADIRSDPWGYAAAGWPEKAAEFAWRDAYISHRRQGVHGEMYFSAAIAAAFALDDPVEALKIGLTEIPKDCAVAKAVAWALDAAPGIPDYLRAREAVDKRFKGMHNVHTINNACLTVFGVAIGGTDLTKAIGETVAMGLDNDCTAATTGSIVGAVVGGSGVPEQWTRGFKNKVVSYLKGQPEFRIDDLVERFRTQAEKVHAG
jgi:ADP-ribosylglycohydrolase